MDYSPARGDDINGTVSFADGGQERAARLDIVEVQQSCVAFSRARRQGAREDKQVEELLVKAEEIRVVLQKEKAGHVKISRTRPAVG